MASLPTTYLTAEQYLEIERAAEIKSEFHDGQMFAMAGGTLAHSFLANRMGGILDGQLPRGCRAFNADLRIHVAAEGLYTYADCSVICGKPEYLEGHKDLAANPVLIVEVLSPATEAYDRGKKFEMYRTIPSFQEYLLVHQDRPRVEHYSRQDSGGWLLREYAGAEASAPVERLGLEIGLGALYAGLDEL